MTSTVTRGVTPIGKVITKPRLWLNNHILFAAVEKEVFILRRECEMCACVKAKRPGWTEVISIQAIPHERISD